MERYPASFQKGYNKALELCADVDMESPLLFLHGESLKRIRKALGATFDTGEGLAKLVETSTRTKVKEVTVDLTPGQKQMLEGQAKDSHLSPSERLEQILNLAVKESLGLY